MKPTADGLMGDVFHSAASSAMRQNGYTWNAEVIAAGVRAVAAAAWREGATAQAAAYGMQVDAGENPYGTEDAK